MTEIKNELGNKSADQLKKYFEALQRYELEKKDLSEKIKEVCDEAKATGFDVKTIKAMVKLAKQDATKRQEEKYLFDTYCDSIQLSFFD
mgnify:CR=1 FL=1|tara:strand:- start:523 stop:789 length:267 start_codon:yes stop_codon:yes gene_type:complete